MASSYILLWISAVWVSLTVLMFLAVDGSSPRNRVLQAADAGR